MITKSLGAALALLLLFAVSGKSFAQEITLTAQHSLDTSHPYHLGLLYFKEKVETYSNGRIEIRVVPSGQLGNERDTVEGLQIGSAEIAAVSTAIQGGFVPEMQIFDLWYLFDDADHLFRVMDGPLGDSLKSKLLGKGIRVLGWWYGGVRDVYTSKKTINDISDIKGLKIRTFENPMYLSALNATGALATPVSFGEVYTAIQQGVVDGAEGASLTYRTIKHFEVAPLLSLTHHTLGGSSLLISERVYKKLPQFAKDVINQAANDSTIFQRQKFLELEAANLGILKGLGIKIVTPDTAAFAKAVRPTYVQFEDTVGKNNIEFILSVR